MRSEQAQATVEYVGGVLALALLFGAMAALLVRSGAGQQLAAAVSSALERALGGAHDPAPLAGVPASAAQLALFERATDPSAPDDDKPSLRDVRLHFEEELGPERGDALLRELLIQQVVALRPGTRDEERFAPTTGAIPSPETMFAPPLPGGPADVERPAGDTTVHVTTAAEENDWLREALHGDSLVGLLIGVAGSIPIPLAERAAMVAGVLHAAAGELNDARNVLVRTDGIDAGGREGDAIACWPVIRTRPDGLSVHTPGDELGWNARSHHLYHVAIVRQDAVVAEYLIPNAKGNTSCNLS
jgi:hypothetical protein